MLFIFLFCQCSQTAEKPISINDSISKQIDSTKLGLIEDVLLDFTCYKYSTHLKPDKLVYEKDHGQSLSRDPHNISEIQTKDTLIVSFNLANGGADWTGSAFVKNDSLLLEYSIADLESTYKMLGYYRFTYKIKNPEYKKYKTRIYYKDILN